MMVGMFVVMAMRIRLTHVAPRKVMIAVLTLGQITPKAPRGRFAVTFLLNRAYRVLYLLLKEH